MDNIKYITKLITGEDLYYLKDTEARNNLIDKTEKGVAGGVATLDDYGKVPSSQLPSYVDDVIEGYYHNDKFYTDDSYTHEIDGEIGKIYVDKASNMTYRWSGSVYIAISSPETGGFQINYDTTTGLKTITSLGAATAAYNTKTGITAFTF